MKQRYFVSTVRIPIFLLCLLIWGCFGGEVTSNQPTTPAAKPAAKPAPKPAPMPVPEPEATRGSETTLPKQHHWDVLLQMDDETAGYGMYTYVLFSRRLDLRGQLDPEIVQRYQALLTAIVSSTVSSTEAGEINAAEKRLINLFYIPDTLRNSLPSLDNYNSALAMRYLDEFSKISRDDNPQVADRLLTRPGPFLLSTLSPLGTLENNQTSSLLYADLSTTNPAAMAEIVAAYKLRLTQERLTATEQFTPLRLALLNLILNADDNIKLVKTALAQWIPQ